MFDSTVVQMLIEGTQATLYMTLVSTLLGYAFGLPMGVLLAISDKEGLRPNPVLYKVLDVIANIVRSVPFLILLILLIPFTRFLVGKSYGATATIVPLVVAAVPFIARMVESSLKEVDQGVIEAARSMGASDIQIVIKVLLLEARTSLITGGTIAIGTILGYSAMSGAVGGGGLGDIAVRYGYYRYQTDIMIVTVVLLIVLVQIFQTVGMAVTTKLDKRKTAVKNKKHGAGESVTFGGK
ncbi:MAG: ABC transporter permease [Clostridiales bacterium]|nr:ABC transporter permease [Clostridiales bacterium]